MHTSLASQSKQFAFIQHFRKAAVSKIKEQKEPYLLVTMTDLFFPPQPTPLSAASKLAQTYSNIVPARLLTIHSHVTLSHEIKCDLNIHKI